MAKADWVSWLSLLVHLTSFKWRWQQQLLLTPCFAGLTLQSTSKVLRRGSKKGAWKQSLGGMEGGEVGDG